MIPWLLVAVIASNPAGLVWLAWLGANVVADAWNAQETEESDEGA